jgi:hypothetical protein
MQEDSSKMRAIAGQFLKMAKKTNTSADSELLQALAGKYGSRAEEIERRQLEGTKRKRQLEGTKGK